MFRSILMITVPGICSAISGQTLITNGGFEQGNVGFTSDYTYSSNGLPQGVIFVGANPRAWNSNFSSCGDHTTGASLMLMVNGQGGGAVVWSETVSVSPNRPYQLSLWATSLHSSSPATLEIDVDGTLVGTVSLSSTTCLWINASLSLTSGHSSQMVISIRDANAAFGGNDFALDDIELTSTDSDGDGLADDDEINVYNTDPNNPDTDGDGLSDGNEVASQMVPGCPDPTNPDSDGDTLLDGAEVTAGTDPCAADTDGDGVDDNLDPLPTTPGVTTGFLEDAAHDAAAILEAIDAALILAPNARAAEGRRNAMANRARNAAKDIANGDPSSAIDKLTSLLDRMDGASEPPDWIVASPERDALVGSLSLLIGLLQV